MPWSPLRYRREIFELMRKRGFEKEVSTAELERAIIEITKLVRQGTIRNVIHILAKIGDIEEKGNDTWLIKYWDKI